MTGNPTLALIETSAKNDICKELDRLGVHHRLYSRVKTHESLTAKIGIKGSGYYAQNGKKVQDLIGFRIVTYFIDDVNLLWQFFLEAFDIVDNMYDNVVPHVFEPLRKNMVCRMNEKSIQLFDEMAQLDSTYSLVDTTFEIQFRTTLSEGWHEVDHLLRYKCQSDWSGYADEGRMFNGVFAALETSDRSLKALFDDMSYNHYKQKNWPAMLRMKFRLQFESSEFSLSDTMTSNKRLAKRVFRFDRNDLIATIAQSGLYMPLFFDNIIYLIIYIENFDRSLTESIPQILVADFISCEIKQRHSY